MMGLLLLIAVFALFAASCTTDLTATPPATALPAPTHTPTDVHDGWYECARGEVVVRIQPPSGWDAMPDGYGNGIMLAEHIESDEDNIEPDGMQVHIFIPDMTKLAITLSAESNFALDVLHYVAHSPIYVTDATVSEPSGFVWHDHHAAYYLVSNKDGIRTIVLAVGIPGGEHVVVTNISAPADHAYRIRRVLPLVLDSLTVGGVRLGSEALTALPDPLEFPPVEEETTLEATPSW